MKRYVKQALLLAVLLLQGCTMYTVEKTAVDGSAIRVTVQSTRSFEQPNLHYSRTDEAATFDFTASSADNNTAVLMGAMASMISMMQKMMVAQ